MTNSDLKCPSCETGLEPGFLYLRGIDGALFWSARGDTGMLSRKRLEQIELDKISTTGTGCQAVIEAWRCPKPIPRRQHPSLLIPKTPLITPVISKMCPKRLPETYFSAPAVSF